MYLLGIRADKIQEEDIVRLIENKIQESKILDYKKELNFSKDKDKKEFLFDITAMHNTDGGCIVYGIEEEKDKNGQNTGRPSKISGIELENSDKVFQQIEDIINNSTEPNISQLILKEIKTKNRTVLIIGIPKGINLPVMVTYNKTNKFYKRRNSGKFLVDVYELNQMFIENQILAEKARDFRKKRIEEVISQETIPNLNVENSFFIHIIPYGFSQQKVSDFSSLEKKLITQMRPFAYGSSSNNWDYMYNIDGFATFSSAYQIGIPTSYNQLFRNGIFEIYSSNIFYDTYHQKPGFNGEKLIKQITESIKQGIDTLEIINIDSPFFVSFSFRNVKGKIMDSQSSLKVPEFIKNDIDFPFIQIPTRDSDIKKLLKPSFDILFQIFGKSGSPDI